MITPKDFVAVGQCYELLLESGSLFTVTHVKRTYDRALGELWYVTLTCVVPPRYAFAAGRTTVEASRDGTVPRPYRRIA